MVIEMIDIGLDAGFDLVLEDGDFLLTESTAEHQQQLIVNNKGDFKQNPTICVGALNYMDDENFQELVRNISIEFTRDGMDVISVQLSPVGIINSDAFYQ
jgi:hypothetical protein